MNKYALKKTTYPGFFNSFPRFLLRKPFHTPVLIQICKNYFRNLSSFVGIFFLMRVFIFNKSGTEDTHCVNGVAASSG